MLPEIILDHVPSDQLENIVDRGVRHKNNVTDRDYLLSFLRISRPLAYATHDESWGEFEKEFAIIVGRMIKAERLLAGKS